MTATYYFCLEPGCPDHGTTTGTESGADRKHVTATGHGTSSTGRGEWVARRAGEVGE